MPFYPAQWRPAPANLHRQLPYYLGRVTDTARIYRNHLDAYGPDNTVTRITGHAYQAAVHNAIVKGATLTDLTAASGLPLPDPCAEVRAELDRPITAVAS